VRRVEINSENAVSLIQSATCSQFLVGKISGGRRQLPCDGFIAARRSCVDILTVMLLPVRQCTMTNFHRFPEQT
jgi:hypothetical protein